MSGLKLFGDPPPVKSCGSSGKDVLYLLFFLCGGTGGTLVVFHTLLPGSRKIFSVLNQFTD